MAIHPDHLKMLKEAGHQGIFLSLARVPNSSRLFVGNSDGKVYDVDPLVEGGKVEFKPLEGHTSYVTGVALSGELLVSGSYDCSLIWRNITTGEIVRKIENAHGKWIRQVKASPDGKWIASVGDDMVVRIWDAATGEKKHELRGHDERTPNHFPSMLYACAFSADSSRLASADRIGRVNVWDVSGGAKLATVDAPGLYTWDPKQRIHSIGGARSVAFSPDGKTIVVGGIGLIGNIDHLDGPARVEAFDWEKGEKLHEFVGEAKGLIESLEFSPNSEWIIGAGGDNGGLVYCLDLANKKVIKGEKAPMHIHAGALSETGDKLFLCGHGRIAVFTLEG